MTSLVLEERESYSSEDWSRHNYRDVILFLRAHARQRDLRGVRDLAKAADVSPSAVAKAMSGSVWPRVSTLNAIAAAVGAQLRLNVLKEAREHLPLRRDMPTLVQELCVMLRRGSPHSISTVATIAGLRPGTVYELFKPDRDPSTQTVFSLAGYFTALVEVVSDEQLNPAFFGRVRSAPGWPRQ